MVESMVETRERERERERQRDRERGRGRGRGREGGGRAKHMNTPILRRFTVKLILFALPRTNKFGLEN